MNFKIQIGFQNLGFDIFIGFEGVCYFMLHM